MNKQLVKKLFRHTVSILSIGVVSALLSEVPFLEGTELILGVLIGSYGFKHVYRLTGKLRGLK